MRKNSMMDKDYDVVLAQNNLNIMILARAAHSRRTAPPLRRCILW